MAGEIVVLKKTPILTSTTIDEKQGSSGRANDPGVMLANGLTCYASRS